MEKKNWHCLSHIEKKHFHIFWAWLFGFCIDLLILICRQKSVVPEIIK